MADTGAAGGRAQARLLTHGAWGHDLIAGVSVALVLIPQAMAYAKLAGLPVQHGLYAAALPPIAAAFFASSPYLQTGPVAITSLLTLGALVPLASPMSGEYVRLAALLAIVVGVVRLALGLFRAGAVAFLLSQPVLHGFTAAAALLIVSSQIPGALGATPASDAVIGGAVRVLADPTGWEAVSVALAGATVVLVLGARRLHPLVPGVLLATLAGIAVSLASGYRGPTVGSVPNAIPGIALALPLSRLSALVLPGVVIALVGFAEPTSIARTFAAQDRRPWDPSREFISQGVASLVAGLTSGFPVGGSFSRSSINRMAGARTRWSGAVAGIAVIVFLPFASVLSPLPRAVLSAIVISAVLGLVRLRPLLALWNLSRPQAIVAWTTFALTLALAPHVEHAVLLGMLLAIGVHLWRELRVPVRSWTDGNAVHLAPQGVLWFASAPAIEDALAVLLASARGARRVVIHLGGLGRIDLTGALVLKQVLEEAQAAGLEADLVDVPPHAHRILASALGWTPPQSSAGPPLTTDQTAGR